MSENLTIAVDVDDVCADLIGEWMVNRYSRQSGHTLERDDVTAWDVTTLVLPTWKAKVYGILNEHDLYDAIEPFDGALDGIEFLRKKGHRVLFVSSCPRKSYDAKAEWLVRHKFVPDAKYLKDFIAASDKSVIAADVLVDDGVHNLETFPKWKILVTRPHNREKGPTKPHWRVEGMLTAACMIDAYLKHDFGYVDVPVEYRGRAVNA